jgi:L-alanine-DL-glutamate epimerase-like enolase superfamily enzyme
MSGSGTLLTGRTGHQAAVERVEARACTVPTDAPEGDGTIAWDSTTIVVVEAHAEERTGTGWTYGPVACAAVVDAVLAPVVVGTDPLAVQGTWEAMVRATRNATRAGVVGYAISAVDVALWDLKAQLLDVPLADLLGRVRDVPVYGSGGFTTYSSAQTKEQLSQWVQGQGIPRVKIKIGESWGREVERDLRRMALARDCIGPDTELYVDANGAYTAKQAVRVMDAAADADVTWFEEPVSSDDLPGLRQVRRAVRADVAAGEYGSDLTYFQRMCAAEAVDCLQVDATRCGGYTEWLRAAAVAAAHGLQVSAHCAPNLHLPVAAATTNLRHIEWFHDHARIERELFVGSADPTGGTIRVQDERAGHGMHLDPDAAGPFLVRGQP